MAAPTSTPTMRFIGGPTNVAAYPAASGYQLNPGDLTVFFSGLLYPVSAWGNVISWNSGTEIQNWSGARATFAGVSLGQQNSYSVVSGNIPVALEGVAQYPFPATSGTTYQPGTFVSFTQDQSSGYFQPQEVMQCSGQATAIGKVMTPFPAYSSGAGLLTVQFQSFLVYGGVAN